MKAMFMPLRELGEYEEIRRKLPENRGMLQVTGCIDSQKAHLIAALISGHQEGKRPSGRDRGQVYVIVAANDLRAKEIYDNYRVFDREALLFPARDLIFYQADVHSNLLEQQRIGVWKALCEGRTMTMITSISALMSRLMPFARWREAVTSLKTGETLDLEEWKKKLSVLGYERVDQVEGPGQFAVRGGILDIFGLSDETPVRVELWGDEIDSIRRFDAMSQRSIENLEELTVYPAAELILDPERSRAGLKKLQKEASLREEALRRGMHTEEAHRIALLFKDVRDRLEEFSDVSGLDPFLTYFYPEAGSLQDELPEDTVYFLDEPNRLTEAADAAEGEFRESMAHRLEKGYILSGQAGLLVSCRGTVASLGGKNCVGLCMLEPPRGEWKISGRFSVQVRAVNPYNNSFDTLVKDLGKWRRDGWRIVVLVSSPTRGSRMAADLQEQELPAFYSMSEERVLMPGEIMVTCGNARRGYEYPLIKFAVISETDIFGREHRRQHRRQRMYEGSRIGSFSELSVGDYVVHESRGLGIYRGIEQIETDHVLKDYMKIEYADGSHLYVPASSLDVIQKYAGSDAKPPRLSRLGTQEWTRTTQRVRGAVRQIARDLVQLYAARQRKEGFVYSADSVWQREFEEMFPFEETEDQLKAIAETKQDMESPKIMDRLICGDVGFGKTEIALRAAFKAVQDGKQVAYLVPTTILAQQHYNTFVERLREFPVRVDLLCRFRSAAEQKKTIEDLKRGFVDIVIGTHRLLSRDVAFRDLGLLIVDEEQRFGVTHKEKIKHLKEDVDVLTLTATPIPRTLHMSLAGIREMSVLEEAPQDRLPIQTFVMEYNEELVREAICRELARDGQVYYVYNRINTIADITARIAAMVPQARVAYAHGKMAERELERIMVDFVNGDVDVLVSTTIIETGLDIANVNTMIIHDADTMGLSQLYQLRGRIGRSGRTSYAFLMYRRDKMLQETAEKRLAAIREFTELGSGFRIAMRDLEIRGAGNLLGAEQHGHMAAVGYDLYCKLLSEAVMEEKGEKRPEESFETTVDLDIDAFIPDRYIAVETQKLDIYKRIAQIRSEEDHDDMLEELLDRFGEPPRSVQNLLVISMLKEMARHVYLTEVTQKGDEFHFVFYERARIDVRRMEAFLAQFGGRMHFRADRQPELVYMRPVRTGRDHTDVLGLVRDILEKMKLLLLEGE